MITVTFRVGVYGGTIYKKESFKSFDDLTEFILSKVENYKWVRIIDNYIEKRSIYVTFFENYTSNNYFKVWDIQSIQEGEGTHYIALKGIKHCSNATAIWVESLKERINPIKKEYKFIE